MVNLINCSAVTIRPIITITSITLGPTQEDTQQQQLSVFSSNILNKKRNVECNIYPDCSACNTKVVVGLSNMVGLVCTLG